MRKFKALIAACMFVVLATTSLTITLVSGVMVNEAHAAVVNRIEVRGNERIDDDVVSSFLTIRPGENFDNFDIDDSIKALFATGLFSDVSIFQQGGALVVDVDENATVNKVFFEGNSRLKDEALTGVVRLRAQSIYSDEQASSDVDLIERAYARVGRRDAQVSYEVIPLENNRVNVIYRVNEGDKTEIARIDFVGNDTFSDRRLSDVISTKESTLLSFLTTNDIYDQNRLNADEELLRRFYFNRGFADFQIVSTTADLDDQANEYIITFTVEEGPRYTFGNIGIDTTISGVDGDALLPLLETQSGEFYSASDVEKSVVAITEQVAGNGFPFVEVVPRGNRNFESNTIDVTYLVDEGARVFIEGIEIIGNDRTRDYVIRRAFDLSEGDAFNRVLIQKTRRELEGLGFFESVNITTRPGSSPDRVIVVVSVVEQSTGDISLSGGFSTNGGASGQISFSERNFLGRGQFLRLSYQASDDEESYAFTFAEPYFLGSRVSSSIALQATESDDVDERQYSVDTQSGTLSFGLPITEDLASSVFYSYQDSDTSAGTSFIDNVGVQGDQDSELSAALTQGLGDFTQSGFGYSFIYNTLDNQQLPREGVRASFSQVFYGAGGDGQFFTTQAQVASYTLLSEEADVVLFGRVRAGHHEVLGDDDGTNFRALDNFQARSKTVRGFDSFGYGPRDPITNDPLGGRTFWNATAELQFPIPFISRSLGLRGAVFADVGQLTNVGDPAIAAVTAANPGLTSAQLGELDDDGLRASVGGSVLWNSPFGPLRVDYAVPISDEPFDDIEELNFGVSSAF